MSPLTEDEYDAFYDYSIQDYADAKVRAGNARLDLAEQVAHQQTALMLTNRLAAPDQFILAIHDDALDAMLGYLWWGVGELSAIRVANLHFISILESYRRHGHATQALRLFEEKARETGLTEMRLFVFRHNARTLNLYTEMGYYDVGKTIAKRNAIQPGDTQR